LFDYCFFFFFFFSSRRRHTRFKCDWSSDVCSSDLGFTNLMQIVIRKAKGDVAADCFAEEIGVLRDVADRATQRIERPFANGAAVDEEFAFGSFPEAGGQRRGGRACTSGGGGEGRGGG